MKNRKYGQGTHCTKIGAASLTKNTPNAPKFVCPSPKVWVFIEKRIHWASVVRVCKTLLMRCAKFNNGIFTTVARLGPSNPTLWYHFEKSRKSLTIYLLLTYTLGRHEILKKSKEIFVMMSMKLYEVMNRCIKKQNLYLML